MRTIIRRVQPSFSRAFGWLKKTSLQVLGDRIRAARKTKGLSQEGLALLSNIDRSYIGGVERGERNLSFKKLCAISWVVECDVGSLCAELPVAHERPHDFEHRKR